MKAVETIIYIRQFEQKCVMIKGVFKSEQLKQHMVNIVVDNYLSNSTMYEHICLKN